MQLGSYERMIDNAVRFYLGFVQVHKDGYWDEKTIDNSFEYDPSILGKLSEIPHVETSVPRLESFALAAFGLKTRGVLIMGIDPEREHKLTRIRDKLIAGSYLEAGDQGVLIAEGLAEYLKVSLNDTLVLLGQGYHGATATGLFPVKGILKFPNPIQNDQTLFMDLDKAQWFYVAENKVTSIALVVDKVKKVPEIKETVQAGLDPENEVMDWKEMMPELIENIELDNVSGQIMLWVLYIVIGFGMFGTFMMMTNERIYEFGILMAIGMKRFRMQWIMILEMGILSTLGVIMGISISLPILIYFNRNPIYFTGEAAKVIESYGIEAVYAFSLEPVIFYSQAWAIFFMSLVFALYPLIVIHKLKIVNAMRQ
jgi:ABC-type lipoprotein release transport system permease subunit